MKTMFNLAVSKFNISVIGSFIIGVFFIIGCGTPKQTVADPQNFDELRDLVNTREFSIVFQWAQPQGSGMVDLMTNPNHIKFKDNEVDVFLPYFGVRHSGGAYGNNSGGIRYVGEILNLKISEDRSKNNILMQFEGRQGSEFLIFNLTLYENGKAYANVSSSERSNINYQGGDVKPTATVTER